MGDARRCERSEHAGVLLVGRQQLIAGAQVEGVEHGVHAVGGRPVQRHLGRVRANQPRDSGAQVSARSISSSKSCRAAAALLGLAAQGRLGGREGLPRRWPVRAGVQVGEPLEHRKLGAEVGMAAGY